VSATKLSELPVPFVTVTNWIRAARLCGINIEAVFRELGIDTSRLHPETATIARETMQNLMRRCIEATRQVNNGQHFPIVLGDTFAFEYMGDVETFITTSATLRDASRALEWIPPLINPYMSFTLAEHGQDARIALTYHVPVTDQGANTIAWAFTEGVMASLAKFRRLLFGQDVPFGRVQFRHDRHAFSTMVEHYLGIPVEWNAPLDALLFDRILLDQPLRGAFPMLHEQAAARVAQKVAQRHAEAEQQTPSGDTALAHQPGHALTQQIERLLRDKPRLLGLGLEALAEELGLHARTLQRRLKDADESHSAILGRVRYELAQQWLRQDSLSIEDISDRLGFTDRRSFTQAFTRWSGKTPSQFRRGGA
jgi:AraC-like DNA-binding protein